MYSESVDGWRSWSRGALRPMRTFIVFEKDDDSYGIWCDLLLRAKRWRSCSLNQRHFSKKLEWSCDPLYPTSPGKADFSLTNSNSSWIQYIGASRAGYESVLEWIDICLPAYCFSSSISISGELPLSLYQMSRFALLKQGSFHLPHGRSPAPLHSISTLLYDLLTFREFHRFLVEHRNLLERPVLWRSWKPYPMEYWTYMSPHSFLQRCRK